MTWVYTNGIYIKVANVVPDPEWPKVVIAGLAVVLCFYVWAQVLRVGQGLKPSQSDT